MKRTQRPPAADSIARNVDLCPEGCGRSTHQGPCAGGQR